MSATIPSYQLALDPLGLTSEQAVETTRALGVPLNSSLKGYKAFFRDGMNPAGPWHAQLPEVVRTLRDDSPEGEVIKFICRVPGIDRDPSTTSLPTTSLETESVLIPMVGTARTLTYTLCLSSQVGCAMGCTFCETAQMGLIRSLKAREIVGQWYAAAHTIGIRPKNIVFMGMGEPLDNYDEVMQAIAILKDHNGPAVPISHITVSTVGRIDGLNKLREKIQEPTWHRLNLAISLNAPNDDVRSAIMPINRRWNLAELQQVLIDWPRFGGNKFCIEYVLIPGVNDTRANAAEIAQFLRPLKSLVRNGATGDVAKDTRERAVLNLIPYNPRRNSPWRAPTEDEVDQFMAYLIEERVFAKRRRTKGRDMMGACGQLGNEQIRQRKLVQLRVDGAE